MSDQQHIIKRQVIEFELCTDSGKEHEIQQAISEIYRTRVLSVMEKTFDRLADPGEVIVVDRLEIDIGEIGLDRINEDFSQKVEEQGFRTLGDKVALKKQEIQSNNSGNSVLSSESKNITISTIAGAQSEWLAHFLRTGHLPWNTAGLRDGDTFTDVLMQFLEENPEPCVTLLRHELRHPLQRKRLVFQCPDEFLERILTACVSGDSGKTSSGRPARLFVYLASGLVKTLSRTGKFEKPPYPGSRFKVWSRVIDLLLSSGQPAVTTEKGSMTAIQNMVQELAKARFGPVKTWEPEAFAGIENLEKEARKVESRSGTTELQGLATSVKEAGVALQREIDQDTGEPHRSQHDDIRAPSGNITAEAKDSTPQHGETRPSSGDHRQQDGGDKKADESGMKGRAKRGTASDRSTAETHKPDRAQHEGSDSVHSGNSTLESGDSTPDSGGGAPKHGESRQSSGNYSQQTGAGKKAADPGPKERAKPGSESKKPEVRSDKQKGAQHFGDSGTQPGKSKPGSIQEKNGKFAPKAAESGAEPKNRQDSGDAMDYGRNTGMKTPDSGHTTEPEREKTSGGKDPTRQPGVNESIIHNAGLVLIHPFIPAFFERLHLVKDKHFINEGAQQRAVHMLQYLATGRQESPEEVLLLNKLLCGITPEIPVIPGIEITREESDECDHLLRHVIRQWKALKNSSPEAVRQTFLVREGLLVKEGMSGGWKVTVERNTFDVLLDKLPWGISIFKLPWTNYLIHVEW